MSASAPAPLGSTDSVPEGEEVASPRIDAPTAPLSAEAMQRKAASPALQKIRGRLHRIASMKGLENTNELAKALSGDVARMNAEEDADAKAAEELDAAKDTLKRRTSLRGRAKTAGIKKEPEERTASPSQDMVPRREMELAQRGWDEALKKMRSLESKNRQFQNNIKKLEQALQEKEEQVDDMSQKLAVMEEQYESKVKECEDLERSIKKEKRDQRNDPQALDNKVPLLEETIADLEEQLNQRNDTISELTDRVHGPTIEELSAQHSEQIESLKRQYDTDLSSLKNEIRQLEAKNDFNPSGDSDLANRIKDLEDYIKDQEETHRSNIAQFREANQQEVQALESQSRTMQEAHKMEIETLSTGFQVQIEEKDRNIKKLQKMSESVSRKRADKSKLEDRVKELEAQIERLKMEHEEKMAEFTASASPAPKAKKMITLQRQRSDENLTKSGGKQSRRMNANSRALLADREKRIEELEKQVAEVSGARDMEVRSMSEHMEMLVTKRLAMEQLVAELRSRVATLEAEIAEQQAKLDAVGKPIPPRHERSKSTSGMISDLRQRIADQERIIAKFRRDDQREEFEFAGVDPSIATQGGVGGSVDSKPIVINPEDSGQADDDPDPEVDQWASMSEHMEKLINERNEYEKENSSLQAQLAASEAIVAKLEAELETFGVDAPMIDNTGSRMVIVAELKQALAEKEKVIADQKRLITNAGGKASLDARIIEYQSMQEQILNLELVNKRQESLLTQHETTISELRIAAGDATPKEVAVRQPLTAEMEAQAAKMTVDLNRIREELQKYLEQLNFAKEELKEVKQQLKRKTKEAADANIKLEEYENSRAQKQEYTQEQLEAKTRELERLRTFTDQKIANLGEQLSAANSTNESNRQRLEEELSKYKKENFDLERKYAALSDERKELSHLKDEMTSAQEREEHLERELNRAIQSKLDLVAAFSDEIERLRKQSMGIVQKG